MRDVPPLAIVAPILFFTGPLPGFIPETADRLPQPIVRRITSDLWILGSPATLNFYAR